ncbi:adrenocortical dysplasia protein homolog isoform X2 [Pogoniulus pusillus]|uniref:adrenocortical dysplasia protein homolog isoform X2 n=1 Tax=Pogoniulus pusillus TaxID=488313 RepID=UPI0030B9433D
MPPQPLPLPAPPLPAPFPAATAARAAPVRSMAAAATECGGASGAAERVRLMLQLLGSRLVFDNRDMAAPKIYVLQPWITNLLLNYEQDATCQTLLAGQILQVLRDSATPEHPEVLQDAILQVSDGSFHIRVVLTCKALQGEEGQRKLNLPNLVCRIIVLQKYTVCFQKEVRLEDCQFYLTVHKFIVLPMERQRMESSDGNQEPSVLQKIRELWLKDLAEENSPSAEPCLSQLLAAIGQSQLAVLKECAEQCLDFGVPAAGEDQSASSRWEAERKEQQGERFLVPASILLVPCEEVAHAPEAGTSQAPGQRDGTSAVPDEQAAESQGSSDDSTVLSDTMVECPDNPWNRNPPMSLTLNSSDDKSSQPALSPKSQQDVDADSNTPDLLEPCSQHSAEDSLLGELQLSSSPSVLCSDSGASPQDVPAAEAASGDAPSPVACPRSPGSPQPSPVLPSSCPQPPPDGAAQCEPADSSGAALLPDSPQHRPACASAHGGAAPGAKRKLLADGQEPQHSQGSPRGKWRDIGGRLEAVGSQQGKKSRREETELRHRKELEEEEEEASPAAGPDPRPEQRRTLQPYVKKLPQYSYEAPSPELCRQIRSIRISKVMLNWACWILTDRETDS